MKHFFRLEQVSGGVQSVRIQHRTAGKAGQERFHQRPGLGGTGRALGRITQPGANQQDRGLLPPDAVDILGRDAALGPRFAGAETALGQAGGHCRQHRFHTCQRNDTGPCAQGTFHGQRRRAPVGRTARHRQHGTKGSLMRIPGTGLDGLPDKIGSYFEHRRLLSGEISPSQSKPYGFASSPKGGAYCGSWIKAALPLPLGEVAARKR